MLAVFLSFWIKGKQLRGTSPLFIVLNLLVAVKSVLPQPHSFDIVHKKKISENIWYLKKNDGILFEPECFEHFASFAIRWKNVGFSYLNLLVYFNSNIFTRFFVHFVIASTMIFLLRNAHGNRRWWKLSRFWCEITLCNVRKWQQYGVSLSFPSAINWTPDSLWSLSHKFALRIIRISCLRWWYLGMLLCDHWLTKPNRLLY